ncbi:MAG TPA: glycosyltransferase family 1 protein, partial [Pyrinomonadaceae bacterium]|nr:glycosyltransferase family 1 protein [Pyrinomonadaceae bacterium]
KKLYLDWPLRRAKYVTAISEATKTEIAKYLPDVASRITVIENPVDPRFEYAPAKFNAEKPEILQLGTVINKNVPRLIRALSGMSCLLTIVGNIDENIAYELEKAKIEHCLIGRLSDDELVDAYKRADIVSFCSTYEGFGLPIIEAQAVGRVVVTSNISPMKEVAGDGAELVDPFDETSIRAGFDRVINDAKHRAHLIEGSRANVARYSAKRAADAYSDIYRQVSADNAKP